MVGRVLCDRKIVSRDGADYELVGHHSLTPGLVEILKDACERKLADYIARRGSAIWQHRRMRGYLSGTLRYEVLKKAKFRCELCGVPADERALEVDHILPRNRGGMKVLSIEGSQIRLGIAAPDEISVHREEIFARALRQHPAPAFPSAGTHNMPALATPTATSR